MGKFEELSLPECIYGSNNPAMFWFVGATDDEDRYLHNDLIVRNSCYDDNTKSLAGHYKTEQEAYNYRNAYYIKHGRLNNVGSNVGSGTNKTHSGSRVLELN